MKIQIRQPLSFSEIGRKDNQEDALYPNPTRVTIDQRVFLMCDGMGGHEHGEVASNTVAKALGEALDATESPRATFDEAIKKAYDALDANDTDDSGKKMGTTMTCLILDEQGALVAHIGDSRVYQIRPSEYDKQAGRLGIKLQTSDHSLVNDLLKAGELTEEEARNYPHKNIITRAMQPHQERRAKAEIDLQDDIKAGDYFFLCCDGVLEQLTNQRLCEILAIPEISDEEKIALIKKECDGMTKDNYTCWLIPIEDVQGVIDNVQNVEEEVIKADVIIEKTEEPTTPTIVHTANAQEQLENIEQGPSPKFPTALKFPKKLNTRLILEIIIAVAAICCVAWLLSDHSGNKGDKEGVKKFEEVVPKAPEQETESSLLDRFVGSFKRLFSSDEKEEEKPEEQDKGKTQTPPPNDGGEKNNSNNPTSGPTDSAQLN